MSSTVALDILEGADPVDLLLADIKFPPGQPHGFALAKMARAQDPSLAVLYLTGYPELANRDPASEFGKVLIKPVALATLVLEASVAIRDRTAKLAAEMHSREAEALARVEEAQLLKAELEEHWTKLQRLRAWTRRLLGR
jgi:DNA-binding LytR/AlgR family response regulator